MQHRRMGRTTSGALLVAGAIAGTSALACSSSSLQMNPDGGPAWSAVTSQAAFPPRMAHVALSFQDRIWIMGGEGTDGAERNDVWSSADGVTWTMATTPTNLATWSPRGLAAGVVFQDKMWLIDGARVGDVWNSTDGASWASMPQPAPFTGRYGHCALVFDDKIWILGGYGAAGTQINDVWSSTDGGTWTKVTDAAAWSPRDNFGCVATGDRMWVIDGVRQGDVWWSIDGATWTQVTPTKPFRPAQAPRSVVWKDEIWLMGGGDLSGQNTSAVFHSPDGVVWNEMTNVPWSPRSFFGAVVHADKVWVIDGDVRVGDVWQMQ
jgi:hypothetical protein